MDELMQTLYDYLLERTYTKYLAQTAHAERCAERDAVGRVLWGRLEPEERALFLASFDQCKSLALTHAAS